MGYEIRCAEKCSLIGGQGPEHFLKHRYSAHANGRRRAAYVAPPDTWDYENVTFPQSF
jgi:hypothetical protein